MNLSPRQLDALRHIADHCRKAVELTGHLNDRGQLESDWAARYALTRCVEIIGEAVTRLGPVLQTEHPEVPWALLVGMRNCLVHGYDEVNVITLWRTVTQSVPELLPQVEAMLATAGPTGSPG